MADHYCEITDEIGIGDTIMINDDNVMGGKIVWLETAVEKNTARSITPTQSEPATGLAYGEAKTYVIRESQVADGVMQYELETDGKSYTWIGFADDPADGWLNINLRALGLDEDIPNN